MATIGNFPLQYGGVNATNPPQFVVYQRAPTINDWQNFALGTIWEYQINTGTTVQPNYLTSQIWILVATARGVGTWKHLRGTSTPTDTIAINTIYITATGSGTYTPTAGMVECIVECVGGGCGSALGASFYLQAYGGASGGYCQRLFTASQIGVSQSYSVGIGGTASNNSGSVAAGNGGNTTFGAFMTAGGATSGDHAANLQGAVGVSSGGGLNINGQIGGVPIFSEDAGATRYTGSGASSIYGIGASMTAYSGAPYGARGSGYGSGSTGMTGNNTGIGYPGQPGIIIITEYF